MIQWGSKQISPSFFNDGFPSLERFCEFGIPIMFVGYSLLAPEAVKAAIYSHPMDNLGIFMAYLGGILAVEQDLRKRED